MSIVTLRLYFQKTNSYSPNFLRASYLDERTLTYEPIVNLWMRDKDPIKNLQTISQSVCLLICSLFHLIINPRPMSGFFKGCLRNLVLL